jgi:hypothetical protein
VAAALDQDLLKEVPGGPDLIQWFAGRVPSFHDAEVIDLALERRNSLCRIKIHAFEGTRDLDSEGYFVSVKHVVVTFQLDRVCELELSDFNHQNVIDGINLARLPNGHILLELEPCYGLYGKIEAENLQISLEPGIPTKSVYLRRKEP